MVLAYRRNPLSDAKTNYPSWAHDDVLSSANRWRQIRDCVEGDEAIKDRAEEYLPKLDAQDADEYALYVRRAPYYNMTSRTVQAMVGMAFRRPPQVTGLPQRLKKRLDRLTYENLSLPLFAKAATAEVVKMGRYGILVDMDKDGAHPPYLEGFTAECIVDWETGEVKGRRVLTAVVLRTIEQVRAGVGAPRETVHVYRKLELVPDGRGGLMYRQRVYRSKEIGVDLSSLAHDEEVIPLRRGLPLDFIPFEIPGALTTTPAVDRSPIADIVHLQIIHFQASAELQAGRFYTANPVFWVNVEGDRDEVTYELGPNRVWKLGTNGKCGINEFNGSGLRYLESACTTTEDQISSLGGRLMGGMARSVAESDNQLKLKEANEHSVLHNVVLSLNHALTRSLRTWAWWQDMDDTDDVEVEISTEFLAQGLDARALRALQQLYEAGQLPLTAYHDCLLRQNVLPDWIDVDDFRAMLEDPAEFPNLPDVLARMKGYPDKETWLQHRKDLRQLRLDETKASADIRIRTEQTRIQKQNANKPPAPAPQPGNGGGNA